MAEKAILNSLSADEIAWYLSTLRLTKARMTSLLLYFRPLYDACGGITLKGEPQLSWYLLRWMGGDYTKTGDTYKKIFAHLFFGKGNMEKAASKWPSAMRTAVITAVDSGYISMTQLTALVREYSPTWPCAGGSTVSLSLDKMRGLFSTGSSNSSAYMSIDDSILPAISTVFKKEQANVKVYDKCPDEALEIFNCEAESAAASREILDAMHSQRIYVRQSAVPFTEKDIKLIASITGIRELFAGCNPPRQLSLYRTRTMMFVLSQATSFISRRNGLPPYHELLRNYFDESSIWAVFAHFVNVAMPYFNRINMSSTEGMSMRFASRIYQLLMKFSQTTPGSQWIDLELLAEFIMESMPAKIKYGITGSCLYVMAPENALNHTRISLSNVLAQYTRPLVYGSMMVIVSMGMAEVAYRKAEPDSDMPFGIFKYIRLTSLGRYVLGLDKVYAIPINRVVNPPAAVLDPDNLIIRTDSAAAGSTIKKLLGEKVTNNRYIVTEASVLRDVQSVADLTRKIDSLRAIVKCELPDLWTDFFDRMTKRIFLIRACPLNEYVMYQITGDVDRFAAAIRDNKSIRRLIRLVEGGAFLVAYKDVPALSELIAGQGYKLPLPEKSTLC